MFLNVTFLGERSAFRLDTVALPAADVNGAGGYLYLQGKSVSRHRQLIGQRY